MSASPSELELLSSPAFLDNPYPLYAQLRAADPVHFIEPYNAWILTRFADASIATRGYDVLPVVWS